MFGLLFVGFADVADFSVTNELNTEFSSCQGLLADLIVLRLEVSLMRFAKLIFSYSLDSFLDFALDGG
jgi:hypothetical protein